MLCDIGCTLGYYSLLVGGVLFAISVLTYTIPFFFHALFFRCQNLKTKYNAKWAVVTGGSSGIGRAIVEKLAKQGVNVVIAALDDDLLRNFMPQITKEYPDLEFRSVPVDLSSPQAVEVLAKATDDIDVQLLFNNAGYIAIGFFADTPIERQMKNLTVNAISPVPITHHFVTKMIQKKLKGCVVFTSSPAGGIPCPFSVMYGTSKAFITEFATSLAGELYHDGIDVLAAHPSPVDTRFYNAPSASKSSSVALFRKTAAPPTVICDYMFATVGRFTSVVDQGYYCFTQKMILKILDWNFFASMLMIFSKSTDEYQTLMKDRKQN
eukprot:CAMPEP_0201523154 /NCGR_PEP_ID=MMETSP0161_2-20130828/18784_1 /ASSEMBLY_ACC=CAM_ASM_000251 /TAXON_ID=180227 /ORGANISM="Neoparamoeba aestuarina, Strain SoJaBio B1-5/56/2" /LENGTH=322 /DNA_ID=CAMNT_0047922163 /DNA_START=51 /DNA_END=1019 /DNA_ORIENTATION=-